MVTVLVTVFSGNEVPLTGGHNPHKKSHPHRKGVRGLRATTRRARTFFMESPYHRPGAVGKHGGLWLSGKPWC